MLRYYTKGRKGSEEDRLIKLWMIQLRRLLSIQEKSGHPLVRECLGSLQPLTQNHNILNIHLGLDRVLGGVSESFLPFHDSGIHGPLMTYLNTVF